MSQEISQLVSLITSAAQTIESEFAASESRAIPSLSNTTAHPFDLRLTQGLRESLRILEGACAQLRATLSPPVCTIIDVSFMPQYVK